MGNIDLHPLVMTNGTKHDLIGYAGSKATAIPAQGNGCFFVFIFVSLFLNF